MIPLGLILCTLAALVHVYIFFLESLSWTSPRARKTFGTSEAEAQATKELAFNQGFYNLFLAIAVVLGLIVFLGGAQGVGATLVLTGSASMAAAAVVLFSSSPEKRGSALKQGVIPLLGVIALAIGLAI